MGDRERYVQTQVDAQLPTLTQPVVRCRSCVPMPSLDWATCDGARRWASSAARMSRSSPDRSRPPWGPRSARRATSAPASRSSCRTRTTCSRRPSPARLAEYPTLEQAFTPSCLPLVDRLGPQRRGLPRDRLTPSRRPSAGTRSPSCSTSATRRHRAPRWNGWARRPGPPRSTTSTTRRFRRAMGEPPGADAAARACSSVRRGTGAGARRPPTRLGGHRGEFRRRMAPHMLNAWHPRMLSYFTPPPLVMSVVGELLAQVTQQGVDVWHAGPVAAFVEEEVVRWLCDLVGYGEGSFGLLASGGVMANFMGLALARDVRLAELRGLSRPPRGAALEDARVYVSDQGHFSVGRALDELGFPAETLVSVPSDERFFRLDRAARDGHRRRPGGRSHAVRGGRAWRAPPTPAPSTTSPASPRSRSAKGSGTTWTRHTAPPPGCRPELAPLVPGLDARRLGDRRSPQVVLPGLRHRWPRGPRRLAAGAGVLAPARVLPGWRGHGAASMTTTTADSLDFYTLGFEGTRRWRALKLWMSWQHLGTEGLGRLVERTAAIAAYLSELDRGQRRLRAAARDPGAVGGLLPPRARRAALGARRAGCAPGRAPGGARGGRRRLAVHDAAARRDLAARRGHEPHDHRGRHRPAAGHAPALRRLDGRGLPVIRDGRQRVWTIAVDRPMRSPSRRRSSGDVSVSAVTVRDLRSPERLVKASLTMSRPRVYPACGGPRQRGRPEPTIRESRDSSILHRPPGGPRGRPHRGHHLCLRGEGRVGGTCCPGSWWVSRWRSACPSPSA